jgi:hypothetical protein
MCTQGSDFRDREEECSCGLFSNREDAEVLAENYRKLADVVSADEVKWVEVDDSRVKDGSPKEEPQPERQYTDQQLIDMIWKDVFYQFPTTLDCFYKPDATLLQILKDWAEGELDHPLPDNLPMPSPEMFNRYRAYMDRQDKRRREQKEKDEKTRATKRQKTECPPKETTSLFMTPIPTSTTPTTTSTK